MLDAQKANRARQILAQRVAALSKLKASKGYLISGEFQISATKNDSGNFDLVINRVGRTTTE